MSALLLEGLAQLCDARGHGVYRRGAPYAAGEIGIVLDGVIPAPDELLVITAYPGPESSSRLPFDEPNIQFRCRGGPDGALSRGRAQALYDDLMGYGPARLPNGVLVLSVIANQAGPIGLGRDEGGRHEHTVNTRIEFHNPTARRPAL